jgi:hypothetical protein
MKLKLINDVNTYDPHLNKFSGPALEIFRWEPGTTGPLSVDHKADLGSIRIQCRSGSMCQKNRGEALSEKKFHQQLLQS